MKIDTTTEILTGTGGIVLAGKIFDDIGLDLESDKVLTSSEKRVIKTIAGLFVQGRNGYAEVEMVRNDPVFQQALGFKQVYAPETVRIYLENIVRKCKDHLLGVLDTVNQNLLKKVILTPIKTSTTKYLPVDIDVSPHGQFGKQKRGGESNL